MNPKLLRVLFAFLFFLSFSFLLGSSYLRVKELAGMEVLADSSCSLLIRLCAEELSSGKPYVVDPSSLSSLEFRRKVGEREVEFRIWAEDLRGRKWGPFGPLPPEGKRKCSLLAPVSLLENFPQPGRLGLEVWWA
ncbi:MAG: hypothetical protein QXG22_02180 [Candidatus Hadarchaeales archaeon]